MAKVNQAAVDAAMKRQYDAEYDARTLSSAGEIMGDPRRHRAATEFLKKQMEGAKKVMARGSGKGRK